ncbi:MAG: DUF427 domain-containing protein [Rhodobacteraceae bacterium]|jgi:uncharacterized protein (DUF427 family)|nr:DUF427 domain-containing protein [Paracoccaceae bacterium]MBL4558501.1 DUF427 domain-containing protein [Paracoccaceae bacterium]HBG99951.1 hypothetical protein [Paracoccaceae bacterium]
MAQTIRIQPAGGTWVVRTGDAVIAESKAALALYEGDRDPVIYFPRADVGMAFLEPSDSRTTCPHKGEAFYFSIHGTSQVIPDAAWSYETPGSEAAAIAGYIAFYGDNAAVEQL